MLTTILIVVILLLLTFGYLIGNRNESYWKKRGVVYLERNKVMGPLWDFLTQDRPLFEILNDIYRKYKGQPAVGVGSFVRPALYVTDSKNVLSVLQTDFHSFSHRGTDINEGDILADNVLFMHGARWKLMRQKMTPLFTAAKLKNMYYIIDKSAVDFVEFLNKNPQKLKGGAFGTINHFCCAAIAGAVFGIGSNSTFESPLLDMAREAFKPTLWSNIRFFINFTFPTLFKLLKLKLLHDYEKVFVGAIKQVLRRREKENVKKYDFADICISLQSSGTMKDPETGCEMEPTDELLAGQAFFFFVAGVEPCATTIFSTLVELSKHPDMLQRVHEEVDAIFDKYDSMLTYENVMVEMEYLEKVLNETLRKHPPIGFLTRKSVKDTVLPVGNIKVDAGTQIFTPIYEIHRDPQFYENPDVFDPERFADGKISVNEQYMPFGIGNRMCIGARYAKLQVKAGLAHLLRNFTVKTIYFKNGERYKKEQVQVRLSNIDVEFVPRNVKSK